MFINNLFKKKDFFQTKNEMIINIVGLGIIAYSPFAVSHILEGENYLESNYWEPEKVISHIYNGTIVGFGTGSAGRYVLKFHQGYPAEINLCEFNLRLGIEVKDRKIIFRDLYDLMDWSQKELKEQTLELDNGFYHLTLCTDIPVSGVIGDNQAIHIYFNKLSQMPELKYDGVPELCY